MEPRNEGFICVVCERDVPPADKTCRNHCPFCFASLHIDKELPGDRKSDCGGVMYPTKYHIANREIKVCFECDKCGHEHWNKTASDDEVGQLDARIKEHKKQLFKE